MYKIALVSLIMFSCNIIETKRVFYENGSIKEEYTLKDGKRDGSYMEYFSDGRIHVIGGFRDNKMDGIWIDYYSNGKQLSSIVYRKGEIISMQAWDKNSNHVIKDGTGTLIYYKNGVKDSQVSYMGCIPHGKWIMWYDNGVILSETFFINGKSHGEWKTYNNDGTIKRLEIYDNGKFVSKKEY